MIHLPDPGQPWRNILSRLPPPPSRSFYIVGGWVRDLFLAGPKALGPDIDLVTDGDLVSWANSVAAFFRADLRIEEDFLTAKIQVPADFGGPFRIDMSRFRREWYDRPGELPHVAPGTLEDDALRRDFSMNAIYLQWSSEKKQIVNIIDPQDGLGDLKKGIVHPINPWTFQEDPTRLFRWARLETRLGLQSDESLRRSIEHAVNLSDLWDHVGGARVYRELERLCNEPDPAEVLKRLFGAGVMRSLGGSSHLSSIRKVRIRRWVTLRKELADLGPVVPAPEVLDREMFFLSLLFGIPRQKARTYMARLGVGEKMRDRLYQVMFEKNSWPFEGLYEGFEKASGRDPGKMRALADGLDLTRILFLMLSAREDDLDFWKGYLGHDRWIPPLLGGEELLKYPEIPAAKRGAILAELRVLQRTGALTGTEQAKRWLGKRASEEQP